MKTNWENFGSGLKRNMKMLFTSYLLIVLILTVILGCLASPYFLTLRNVENVLTFAAVVSVIAVGQFFVVVTGGIDLSVGSIAALAAGLGVVVLNSTESIFLMLLFCTVFGAVLGLVNGLLVTKGKIAAFIVTLATMSAYRSIIVQLGQGGPFNVSQNMYESFRMIAAGKFSGIPNLAVFFVILALIIAFIMTRTKFGRYVYAVGSNETASALTGINVARIKILCFSITGALTGISAFLLSSRLTSITAPNAGMSFELDAIAAVAIGGTAMSGGRGKIMGTFLGIIMLQMIEGILIAARIPPFLTGLVKGVIIILAVLLQGKKD